MNATRHQPLATLLLLLFMLAAFALRVYRLDTQSLWYDEGVTATLTQRSLIELTQWTARDIQPPLYYYVVAGWGRPAGWSEWSLRFVSVWWGVLTVPLMAVLTQKLTNSRTAAQVAALLTACHPLFVYYSQEARMYAMVVALGVLAGYLFLYATRAEEGTRRSWVRYVLVATAAVYTHYFASFLLLAFVVAGLFAQQGERRRIGTILGAHVAVVLLFAAWVVPLLTQLSTDRSYWQGTFKLGEAVRIVALRFVVGETVLEEFAGQYMWPAGVVTAVALGAITVAAWRRHEMRNTLRYTVSWLLIPTSCVLFLAVAVPKFNVRYVILALPGLILLWSCGVAALAHMVNIPKRTGVPGTAHHHPMKDTTSGPFPARLPVALSLLTLPLLAIFTIANVNWFTDHSFLKAQWREAAAYVRLHHEPGEAVILVSGHTWPVWDYYAPDLSAIHLPDLEILNVNAVLDFTESGLLLHESLQGYNGAWLVNWQDEVVDPTGVVPVQLEWAGREKTFRSEFWEVGLRRFIELDPDAIPVTPPLAEQLDANFGDQLVLHGYNTTDEQELLLFWQLGPQPTAQHTDWQISLRTETEHGLHYYTPTNRRPTSYTYPVERWQPGEIVMGVIPADEWAGPAAMPGAYGVQLSVYDPAGDRAGLDQLDGAGQPQGKEITLNVPLRVHTSDRPLTVPEDVVQVDPEIRLHFQPEPTEGEPGQRITANLLWYLEDSFTADAFGVQWRTVDDEQLVAEAPLPLPSGQPMAIWPRHDWVRQVLPLPVPLNLVPGEYWLQLAPLPGTRQAGETNPVRRRFTVLPSTRSFAVPPLDQSVDTDFFAGSAGETAELRLLGLLNPPPQMLDPEAALTTTLVWQTGGEQSGPQHDYAISLQLLDATGLPAGQSDVVLAGGTSTWLPGQVVSQTVTIPGPRPVGTIPGPRPVGTYQLIVVVYDPNRNGNPRLVTESGEDFVLLAPEITVP